MITLFDTGYAGHVDMSNIGYSGTAVNDRSFADEYLTSAFDKAKSIAQLANRVGYDTFWLAEHHFQPEGYECIPNILMLHLHLAHITDQIKLGCGFNITPMWHPLRLAEDFAIADILTEGRVKFGIGRGYHTREVETFGAPLLDQEENRDLFEDQIDIIFKAFQQRSFSHHSKFYDLPPKVAYRGYELEELTLVPRPKNQPVECWQPIQSATQRSLDFMAKHHIKGAVGGGATDGGALLRVVEAYRDALARAGRDVQLGEDLSIGFHFHIAETREKAIAEASSYFEENLKMFGPLRLVRALSEQQIEAMSDPNIAPHSELPRIDSAVERGAFLCGPPELITQQLMDLEQQYPGLARVNVSHPLGTPQGVILEQLEWFASEVMPVFQGRLSAT